MKRSLPGHTYIPTYTYITGYDTCHPSAKYSSVQRWDMRQDRKNSEKTKGNQKLQIQKRTYKYANFATIITTKVIFRTQAHNIHTLYMVCIWYVCTCMLASTLLLPYDTNKITKTKNTQQQKQVNIWYGDWFVCNKGLYWNDISCVIFVAISQY